MLSTLVATVKLVNGGHVYKCDYDISEPRHTGFIN